MAGLNFDFTLNTPQGQQPGTAIGQYRYNVGYATFDNLVPMEPVGNLHDQLIPDESRPPYHSATVNPDVPAHPGTLKPVQVAGPGTQHPRFQFPLNQDRATLLIVYRAMKKCLFK